jgi:hypothetical protein
MRATEGQRERWTGQIATLRASAPRKGPGPSRVANRSTDGAEDRRPAVRLVYGVGMRVFTDRRLLRQIRRDIVSNVMKAEQVAALENVTPELLIALLDQHLDSGAHLRAYVAARPGFRTGAWRTTRHQASKLHVFDQGGETLCGTPVSGERAPVHSGPCRTCAAHAGFTALEQRPKRAQAPRSETTRPDRDGRRAVD